MSVKISIVVPVHNTERYLNRCLLSLVQQTIRDIEIICVNDLSTDGSLSVLEDFASKDARIKIINLQENKRAGGARNAGIECATGEYVAFVDSDDWVDYTKYEKLYNRAKATGAQVVTCQYYRYLSESNIILENNFPEYLESALPDEINKYVIVHGMRIWTNIYKRELLTNVRFPEKCITEDNPVGPLLHLNKQISLVNEGLHFYRMDNQSLTRRRNNYDFFDKIDTSKLYLNNILYFYGKNFYSTYIKEIEYYFSKVYFIQTVLGAVSKFNKPQIDYIIKVKKGIKEIFPNFYHNPYYKENTSFLVKIMVRLIYTCPIFGAYTYYLISKSKMIKISK